MTAQLEKTESVQLKLSESIEGLLCCPVCKSKLAREKGELKCTNSECQTEFPIVNNLPILINENCSIFTIADFLNNKSTTFDLTPKSKIKQFVRELIPDISLNIKGKNNYKKFAKLLLNQNKNPKVLVIGGSIVGQGMEAILSVPSIEIIGTDVSFGPHTSLICDAHDIPFENNSFDGVIVQAVLEHVVDPNRCVEEIHRVLKEDGLVYAETPFMQQVHMGRYDFTRFTHLGHRRLFRKFEEVCSGPVGGPGMALAWSYQYFLLSFVKNKMAKSVLNTFAKLTSFWIKYFDYYLIDKAGTYDAASAYYFIGKKSDRVLSDRELLELYKGTQ